MKSIKFVPSIQPEMEVYIDKPPTSAKTQSEFLSNQYRSKLQHKTDGPFKVLSAASNNVKIRKESTHNTVSKDRGTVVPSVNGDSTGNPGKPKNHDNGDAGIDWNAVENTTSSTKEL